MKWFVVFALIFCYYSCCIWSFYNKATTGGSWVFNDPVPNTKGYVAKPDWNETPLSRRPYWVMKYTHLPSYMMFVTDFVGVVGCFAARYGLGHRWWFRVYLGLCVVVLIAWNMTRLSALGIQIMFPVIIIPPTIGSILILPLLVYDKLFPSRVKGDVESDCKIAPTA